MRWVLALGGALVLAGCATSKERVTLLDPAETPGSLESEQRAAGEQPKIGGLILDPDGSATPLEGANEQAALYGDGRAPRIRQLSGRRAEYTEVMRVLPLESVSEIFNFESSEEQLAPAELQRLELFLRNYIGRYRMYYAETPEAERPSFHVIIEGSADSGGEAETPDAELAQINQRLSESRANTVRGQVWALVDSSGIPITPEQIEAYGLGQGEALRDNNGRRVRDPKYRKVTVTVR